MDSRRIPFTSEDEERIASAGTWGIIIAIASIASSLLSLVAQVIVALQGGTRAGLATVIASNFIPIAIGLVLGLWLLQAGQAFRKVALTDEADQYYLLLGFSKLRNYFMLLGVLIIIALCAVAIGMCSVAAMRLR